jgi:hypothetical protein
MIQDRWGRKQCNDPSVSHDTAYKVKTMSRELL